MEKDGGQKALAVLQILLYLIYERNVISRAVDAANGCHAGHPRFLEISWTLSSMKPSNKNHRPSVHGGTVSGERQAFPEMQSNLNFPARC